MEINKKTSLEQFFYLHPIFRREEFIAFKTAQGIKNPGTINQALHYNLKKQYILAIKRGLFATISPIETPKTALVDPYLIASKAAEDSVLSHHTALELHGIAYSASQKFTFLTQHKIKPFEYRSQWMQSILISAVHKRNKIVNFGVNNIDRRGVNIKVTSIERTFVDVLDRIDLGGGWEELCRSISNIAALNADQVVYYCLKLANAATVAKVGFFLEQRKGAFAPSTKNIRDLLAKKPKQRYYLSKNESSKCRYIKKWGLMVPTRIIDKIWEEPNNDSQ
jgi:predicted transcriptional regulator of viral defense system